MPRSSFLTALLTTTLTAVAFQPLAAQQPGPSIASGQRSVVKTVGHEQGPRLLSPGQQVPTTLPAPDQDHPQLFHAARYHKPIAQSRNTVPVQTVSDPRTTAAPKQVPAHGYYHGTYNPYGYGAYQGRVNAPTYNPQYYGNYQGRGYPNMNAPLSPTPRPNIPYQTGGTIITNQAFAPHEMLWAHEYNAMYPPYYYKVKGRWFLTPRGVRSHERWKLEGTRVQVKYKSSIPWHSLFRPPVNH